MLHSLLKLWCRISLYFFYRNRQVHFQTHLPVAPTIFLANHPNTFLDAILIACSIDQKPWFLARGEVFKSKWSAWILTQLRLIPIFRFRDGHSSLRRNEDMINRCAEILLKGESIILFPEGDNSLQGNLLPLQKGFIKIAEAACAKNPDVDLQIVPVGINYLYTKGFGGTVILNFGESIRFGELSKGKTKEEILKLTWEKLNVLLHVKAENRTERKITWLRNLNSIYYTINNFFLRTAVRNIASLIKEEPIRNSMKFAAGMFLVLPVYLMQSSIIFMLTNSWAISLSYFITLLITIRIKLRWN